MFCKCCGAPSSDGAAFCSSCGKGIGQTSTNPSLFLEPAKHRRLHRTAIQPLSRLCSLHDAGNMVVRR